MAHFYFDESIQERGGFVLGAYVYGPDADVEVSAALERVGLRPGDAEFKSSARMSEHPEQVTLRAELQRVLADYRVGVLVAPNGDRASLGVEAIRGLDQIARANELTAGMRLMAFLDQGIFDSSQKAAALCAAIGLDQYCDVKAEQDSRAVKGLQLADLVAHTAGVMLLDTLGLVKKRVKAGPGSAERRRDLQRQ